LRCPSYPFRRYFTLTRINWRGHGPAHGARRPFSPVWFRKLSCVPGTHFSRKGRGSSH
jgi:hypothetical protein